MDKTTDKQALKDNLLQLIQERPGTSFAELDDVAGVRGEYAWGTSANVFFWFNLSQEAIASLEELIDEGLIEMNPTSPLTYVADGAIPDVPLARQRRQYKSERWLPVTFSVTAGSKE